MVLKLEKLIKELETKDKDYNPTILITYYSTFNMNQIIKELENVVINKNDANAYD